MSSQVKDDNFKRKFEYYKNIDNRTTPRANRMLFYCRLFIYLTLFSILALLFSPAPQQDSKLINVFGLFQISSYSFIFGSSIILLLIGVFYFMVCYFKANKEYFIFEKSYYEGDLLTLFNDEDSQNTIRAFRNNIIHRVKENAGLTGGTALWIYDRTQQIIRDNEKNMDTTYRMIQEIRSLEEDK